MSALRACLARILRRDKNKESSTPSLLIAELSCEFSPTLIENSSVQSRLGLYITSGILNSTFADFVMLLNDKSSIHTIAWFLLSAHEDLCR